MRFSEAKGLKVVSKATAETVGKITDYVLNPAAGTVAALVLKKTNGQGDTLAWSDITAFGDDAVIISSEDVIVAATGELAELADKSHHADGKRVLSTDGVDLGDVKDVGFDPATGTILSLELKDTSIEDPKLLAVGSYAVVVKAS
jgi:uncharacterized protein YrrD